MEKEELSVQDVKAYNELLAIQHGPEHHRFKMRKIAERSRSGAVGRALNGILHLRLDDAGNPEIVYNKQKVIVRFAVGGLRLYSDYSIADRSATQLIEECIRMYTGYTRNSSQELVPLDVDKQCQDAGYIKHDTWYRAKCGCDDCVALLNPWLDKVKARNDAYTEYKKSLFITAEIVVDADRGRNGYLFEMVPYDDSKDMKKLPSLVQNQWEKVKVARDWNRRKYA